MTYEVNCNECEGSYTCENESEAVGWMFGHAMANDHDDIEKYEV